MTTSNQTDVHHAVAFAWLALLSLAGSAAVVALGYWPTRALAGYAGVGAMCVGVGLALLAALAGLVPALLTFGRDPRWRLGGLLTGMAIRFILTLGLLITALLSGWLPKVPLALWAVIGYLVLLIIDTVGIARLSSRCARTLT